MKNLSSALKQSSAREAFPKRHILMSSLFTRAKAVWTESKGRSSCQWVRRAGRKQDPVGRGRAEGAKKIFHLQPFQKEQCFHSPTTNTINRHIIENLYT